MKILKKYIILEGFKQNGYYHRNQRNFCTSTHGQGCHDWSVGKVAENALTVNFLRLGSGT